jgi:hypothetical protein
LKAAKNNQKVLFEYDEQGNRTGYMVRALNYGRFQRDYKLALQQIKSDLGIQDGELSLPENRTLRIEYNRRKN